MAGLSMVTIIICVVAAFIIDHGETTSADQKQRLSMIVNGYKAKEKQFPYAVSLKAKSSSDLKCLRINVCTLSLITTKTCLGAAHCTEDFHKGGEYEGCGIVGTIDNSGCENCQIFSQIIGHEKYDGKEYDIATFIFKEEVKYSEYIQPIPLASEKLVIPETLITVLGWGRISHPIWDDSIVRTTTLRYVEVPVLPGTTCNEGKGKKNFLCIETRGKGPCHGDSGGPNVISISGQDVQIGVSVSVYITCALFQSKSLDVRQYNQWIIDNSDTAPTFI